MGFAADGMANLGGWGGKRVEVDAIAGACDAGGEGFSGCGEVGEKIVEGVWGGCGMRSLEEGVEFLIPIHGNDAIEGYRRDTRNSNLFRSKNYFFL